MNKLENLYLDNKYNEFKKKFNIWVMLWGFCYLLYRELYILGIIIFIVDVVLFYFKIYVGIVIINVFLAFIFNRIYLYVIKNKIEDYKIKYMDNRLVTKECQKKHTNINASVIGVAIVLMIISISYIDFHKYKIGIGDLSFYLNGDWIEGNYNNNYYVSYYYKDDDRCNLTIEIIKYQNEDKYLDDVLDSYTLKPEYL